MNLVASEPQSSETQMENQQVVFKVFIQTPKSAVQVWLRIYSPV